MTTHELSDQQMRELKVDYLHERYRDELDETPSWGEMLWAEDNIPDDEIHEWYAGTVFSDDDFCCTAA